MLLLPHLGSANLRRISDPHVMSRRAGHVQKPLAVPGGLHPDQGRRRQSTVKLLRFSRRVLQLPFLGLPSDRVYPTNLLPTGVVITSNDHHRRLLPADRFGPPTRSILGYERSLRSYPISPRFVRVGLLVWNAEGIE